MITARRFVLIVLVCASLSCAAGIGRTVTVFRDSPRRGLTEKTDGGAEPTPVAFLDDKSKKKNSKKNKEKETPASPPEKSKNKNKDKKKGTEAPVETPKAPAKAPAKAPVVTPAKAPAKAPAVTPATAPVVAAPDANATANTGTTITADSSGRKVFDVTQFGAVVNDDQKDNAQAFIKTWVAACKNSAEPAKILIPAGSFLVGPVVFQGPCKSTKPIMIEVVGTIKGSTDISDYPSPEWFDIEMVQGIIITGKGTFDGQGPKVWHYNDCKTNPDCQKLPASIKFSRCGNGLVEGITSLNAKWFHIFAYESKNFTFRDIKIIAPDESPNTDGIHLSSTTSVSISNTKIGTGDDCIAIASDNHDVTITGVTCGPGHGISVGSLGKWPNDKGVTNIHVNNCTFDNTTNGARIKTWGGTTSGEASGITYDNLIMKNVKNPIIIDQNYGRQNQASKWKLDNIHFRNIKGTSSSKVSVSLGCSSQFPCQGVELANIDLTYGGDKFQPGSKTDSVCENAKIIESGTLNPKPCSSPGKPISQN